MKSNAGALDDTEEAQMVDTSVNVLVVGMDKTRRDLQARLRRIGFPERCIRLVGSVDAARSLLLSPETNIGLVICEVFIRNRGGIRGDVLLRTVRARAETHLIAMPFVLVFVQDVEDLSFGDREDRSQAFQGAKSFRGECVTSISHWTEVRDAMIRASFLVAT